MAGMSSYVNPREELDDIDDIIRPLLQGGHGIQGGVANELFGEGPSAGQEHHIEVHVLDLKDIYDKVQKKTAHGSEQHVSNGVVNIEITTTAQVSKIVVFVRRCERAAEKTNDTIGASSYGTNPSPFSPFSNSPGSFSTDNDVGGPSSIRTSENRLQIVISLAGVVSSIRPRSRDHKSTNDRQRCIHENHSCIQETMRDCPSWSFAV
ncbi:hypothetical protein QZH41_010489 [Actinostola sp. cb2023]|nr:hypothetical protein QZH41_010489 [Actinostola sp. cb2023]